jgi:hypothetical protein
LPRWDVIPVTSTQVVFEFCHKLYLIHKLLSPMNYDQAWLEVEEIDHKQRIRRNVIRNAGTSRNVE